MNNFNNSFYDIFNYLPTGIFIIDSDKKICFWNSVLAEWSGLSKEQVLNNSLSNILPKYSFPYYNLQIESVLNGGPTVFFSSELHSQFIFNTNDALNYKIHSTTISALPHNNSEKHYALFTLIDETTQTNTIKENFKITNEYRIEIENRKAIEKDLIYAKEIAEENNKLKSAFLTNMSHEVRTPMNGIIGFSQMLVRDSVSEEKRQTYANIIIDSGKQLLAIVDDILDISKIETNQVNITEEFFSLNNLMLEIYVFFKPKVAEKNISILIHKPLPDGHDIVFTDRQILKQILFNLIANSLKFTIEGFIKYGYNIEANQIVFFTEDSGIGISS